MNKKRQKLCAYEKNNRSKSKNTFLFWQKSYHFKPAEH